MQDDDIVIIVQVSCGKQFSPLSHSLAVGACPLLQDNIDLAWLLEIPVSTLQIVHAVLTGV